MSAVKITRNYFSGTSHVFNAQPDGLANILRQFAIALARIKVESAGVSDLTDNTTGTAATTYAVMTLPATSYDATASGGSQVTNFNTSMGKVTNGFAVLVSSINNVNARLGLPAMVDAYGTVASANTVPAQDLASTAASSTSAATFLSMYAACSAAKKNFANIALAADAVLVSLGLTALSVGQGSVTLSNTIIAIPAVTAVAVGPAAAKATEVDAFMAALANNFATLAQTWNNALTQGATITVVTDSTGGTAAAALAANTRPVAADGAATTSAPKAGFDTQLAIYNDALAQLALRTNILLGEYGLAQLTNSTGVTSDDHTIDAMAVTLSAVDGSGGSTSVEQVSARARMTTVANGLSSIGAKINILAPYFGTAALGTDALGGAVSSTIAAVAATAAGTSGVGATLLNTAVQTWMAGTRNNFSTLAAALNLMLGANAPNFPLNVVAG